MKVHKSSQELQETIEGYKLVIQELRKEIWELKQISFEKSLRK